MAKMRYPFMQFYVDDWLNDPALSLCAPATRGVWMDLLCAMHKAGRVGSLRGTPDQLARLARCVPADLAQALTDIQTTGAADVLIERNGCVTVTNRRMDRDSKTRDGNRLRQAACRDSDACHEPVTDSSRESVLLASVSLFPPVLNFPEFKNSLQEWLSYKKGGYTDIGFKKMLKLAEKRAGEHGLDAVIEAIDKAISEGWKGWDHESSYRSGGQRKDDPRGTFAAGARYLAKRMGEPDAKE